MNCPLCRHAKIEAIDAALASGRSPNLVRAQYRLEQQMLYDHIAHKMANTKAVMPPTHSNHLSVAELSSTTAPTHVLPTHDASNHLSDKPLLRSEMITHDPVGILADAWTATSDLPKLRRQQLRQMLPDVLADEGLRQVLMEFIERDMASEEWA